MFIGHLPAGYLLAHFLYKTLKLENIPKRTILSVSLVGSVLPDFDLFYFYLIDNKQHSHHTYWSHMPMFWLVLYLISMLTSRIWKSARLLPLSTVLVFSVLLHLFLDSIVGSIYWLYPLSDITLTLVEVFPKYNWWVLNFILHWTFALEVVVLTLAVLLHIKSRRHLITEKLPNN